jgi:Lon-like ATP-dependent protease
VDHYLDHPVDFSRVLFICTANDESTIPGPLLDRMEIIRLSGYDLQEKVAIAQKYLVPKVFTDSGLSTPSKISSLAIQCSIDEAALQQLVKNYSRESGVRSLEKLLEKIARKIAFQIATEIDNDESSAAALSSTTPSPPTVSPAEAVPPAIEQAATPVVEKKIQVTTGNLETYVGKPIFQQDSIYSLDSSDDGDVADKEQTVKDSTKKSNHLPVGVVMGLGWNPYGGSTIFIETACIPVSFSERGSDSVNVITGQLVPPLCIYYTYVEIIVVLQKSFMLGRAL